MKVRVRADLVCESLDVGKRALRELDVDLARELQTDAARVLAGRTGAEPVAFENENVADTFLCEVVRDGGADDPATNDDDIGIATHRGDGREEFVGPPKGWRRTYNLVSRRRIRIGTGARFRSVCRKT